MINIYIFAWLASVPACIGIWGVGTELEISSVIFGKAWGGNNEQHQEQVFPKAYHLKPLIEESRTVMVSPPAMEITLPVRAWLSAGTDKQTE